MERREVLKGLGLVSLASLLPLERARAAIQQMAAADLKAGGGCVLIPQETEGPYPLDLSNDANMFRQVINESKTGLPLNLTLTVVNINNDCEPVPNARVDIWHCDKDGYYSGYTNNGYLGNQNNAGATFCRGIQLTDSLGQVQFSTIYPGWYTGRITHIHFQVFINSVLRATSQMAFDDSINTAVYNTSLYSAHGQNTSVANNAADMVFSDMANTQYEMLALTANSQTGGYDGTLTIGISVPTTGLINLEPETGGQFKLLQNYPNPFSSVTTIPFVLTNHSDVTVEIFDLSGKKLRAIVNKDMPAGEQKILLNRNDNGTYLANGNYVFQLTVSNANGTYRQCKSLTIQ